MESIGFDSERRSRYFGGDEVKVTAGRPYAHAEHGKARTNEDGKGSRRRRMEKELDGS